MPESQPRPAPQPPTPAAPPRAPDFAELFETALAALVDPSVFRRLAARPSPSFGVSAGFALAAGGASLAINLAHALVSNPDLLRQFPPLMLAAVGGAALGLYASVLLLLSVMLYGLGNAFGGKGEFERGLQAAAMISALGPIQMLCSWFPAAWVLPALLAGWVAAGALEGLFGARPGPVRALCAALAAVAIGLQFAGRMLADRARDAYAATRTMTEAAGSSADLARSMAAFQQQAAAAMPAPAGPAAASAPAPASGRDLLRGGPSDDAASPAGPAAAPGQAPANAMPPGVLAATQGLQANAAGMLDALTPLLAGLSANKNMTPLQKADMKELQNLVADIKTQLASGQPVDNAAFAAKMARYQQLLARVMAGGLSLAPPGASGPAAKPAPHLVIPKDER